MDQRSMGLVLILIFFSVISCISPSYGYDSMDPNGNITIKWDIMQWYQDTYDVTVLVSNFQLFRHVERPGWKLSWKWQGDEVIWGMWGAEATEQGNCSRFKGSPQLPHSCEKEPVIIDLLPGAPYNLQVANCCKGGVLSSMTQDPSKYGAGFQMSVGVSSSYNNSTNSTTHADSDDGDYSSDNSTNSSTNNATNVMPGSFSLGLPGYTCGEPFEVPPSKFRVDKGRRRTQALMTWKVTCSYSQFQASLAPTCCVSLSAFYNETIIPCPRCSCGCQGLPGAKCVKPDEEPPLLRLTKSEEEEPQPLVRCSQHMCPIRVHWHVKESYREYWRVKITVTNLNFVQNYSQWNLVAVHPNFQSVTQVFSFNYKPLNQYGYINDTGMFWGIQYYNDMLLQTGESGNVQTEMLLRKDPGVFTFREGWAFPRKISFNGQQCVMPPPDDYPRLPNSGQSGSPAMPCIILFSLLSFIVMF